MTVPASGPERRIALIGLGAGEYAAIDLDENDGEQQRTLLPGAELAGWVSSVEAADGPRWIIRSAAEIYALLLREGVRIGRSHDLVLCHAILRDTAMVTSPLPAAVTWERRDPIDRPPLSSTCSRRSRGSRRSPRHSTSIERSAL